MKPEHSFKDSDGHLWVACCECNRGGNGDKSCSCGWKCVKWDHLGCFAGELMDNIPEPPPEPKRTKAQARYACWHYLYYEDLFGGSFGDFLEYIQTEKKCKDYRYEDWYKKDVERINRLKSEWGF